VDYLNITPRNYKLYLKESAIDHYKTEELIKDILMLPYLELIVSKLNIRKLK
jgi:hypothetical protein